MRVDALVFSAKGSVLGNQFFLGVDGGGSKTAAWLASSASAEPAALQIIGRGTSGPSNPRAIGFDTAFANLRAAISAAFASAGREIDSVQSACFCIAGAGRPAEQARLREWIESKSLAQHYRLAMDVEAVLAAVPRIAASAGGIALIAGTGSMAWGVNRQGQTTRCGGWGPLLGDEGSGYAIALQGLQAVCQAVDGRGPATALLAAFLHALRCSQPADLIEWMHDPRTQPDAVANLCPIVFQCAVHDDTAQRIVQRAASDLNLTVRAVATKLGLHQAAYQLAFAGGVLCHQRQLVDGVLERLRAEGLEPTAWQCVEQPVAGALEIARQLSAAR